MASPASNEDTKARSGPPLPTVDLSKPRYDQSTYQGRLRHFMETTNPLNVFASNKQLDEAATLVKLYKWVYCIILYIDNIPYTTTMNHSIVHVQNFRCSIFIVTSRNTGNIMFLLWRWGWELMLRYWWCMSLEWLALAVSSSPAMRIIRMLHSMCL